MPKKIYEPVGHHYIVDASGCNPKVIVRAFQELLRLRRRILSEP